MIEFSEDGLTCFTDTSDVSDKAIQWSLFKADFSFGRTVQEVRVACADPFGAWARLCIMNARLAQLHKPELREDPDLKIAMQIAQKHVAYVVKETDKVVLAVLDAYKKGKDFGQ